MNSGNALTSTLMSEVHAESEFGKFEVLIISADYVAGYVLTPVELAPSCLHLLSPPLRILKYEYNLTEFPQILIFVTVQNVQHP